eukprot:TRINITY_DN5013_c0_g1_i1.p1 TRINITY_DN5013_c0_g1~~TRINITY_DN5013_c0_g1_i1.p1  ORF type:complete len:267 (+),score=42.18 TRINITY_DN5013_c0_g1_i1:417-1217(+)
MLLFFGGQIVNICPKEVCNDVFIFNTSTLKWSYPKVYGDIPSPRGWCSANVVGNKMFLFGGGSFNESWREGTLCNDMYTLDLITWEWTKVVTHGTQPSPRAAHSSAIINDILIIQGGGNFTGAVYDDTFLFNIRTMTWSLLVFEPGCNIPGIGSSFGCAIGNYFFLFCGWLGMDEESNNKGALNTVMMLDIEKKKWVELRPPPDDKLLKNRSAITACFYGGRWYCFGGIKMESKSSPAWITDEVIVIQPSKTPNFTIKNVDNYPSE